MLNKPLLHQLAVLHDDPLLKLSDALPLIGVAHRSTAMRWHRAGRLQLVKIGAFYRVRASEVLRLAEGRIQQCLERVESAKISSAP